MKWLAVGSLAAIGVLLLRRSSIGPRIGNEVRGLSDKVVLATLQLTSEFESEA